jgi:hypothetical protein
MDAFVGCFARFFVPWRESKKGKRARPRTMAEADRGRGQRRREQEAGVAMEPVCEREGVRGTARVLVPTPSSVTG